MDAILETKNLSFSFGKTPVLKDLSLSVPPGSVYGFLGPNGAGKSTTIKLLLGLLRPRHEEVLIFGKDIRSHRQAILARIGHLIESPTVYQHLTAKENLRYLEILFPGNKHRKEEVLDLVGLTHATNKKVKHFSMGMKQRLGIAMALYHDPDFLILDEPVNGLDPQGIHEMRALFLRLKEAGKTILVSSHLLSEIEKVCTHLGIIKKGEMVFQGPIGDLQSTTRRTVHLYTDDPARISQLAEQHEWAVQPNGQKVSVEIENDDAFNELLRVVVQANVRVHDLEREAPSLEQLFMDLTNV